LEASDSSLPELGLFYFSDLVLSPRRLAKAYAGSWSALPLAQTSDVDRLWKA